MDQDLVVGNLGQASDPQKLGVAETVTVAVVALLILIGAGDLHAIEGAIVAEVGPDRGLEAPVSDRVNWLCIYCTHGRFPFFVSGVWRPSP